RALLRLIRCIRGVGFSPRVWAEAHTTNLQSSSDEELISPLELDAGAVEEDIAVMVATRRFRQIVVNLILRRADLESPQNVITRPDSGMGSNKNVEIETHLVKLTEDCLAVTALAADQPVAALELDVRLQKVDAPGALGGEIDGQPH